MDELVNRSVLGERVRKKVETIHIESSFRGARKFGYKELVLLSVLSTGENPADLLTRGVLVENLIGKELGGMVRVGFEKIVIVGLSNCQKSPQIWMR